MTIRQRLSNRIRRRSPERKSIFRSLFLPLFFLMVLQALFFYFSAIYGGIEATLSQNAADVLSERLYSRKYELETKFNNKWTDLDACSAALGKLYAEYEAAEGQQPLLNSSTLQIQFLNDSASLLIDTLRQNEVNGIFLILNDRAAAEPFPAEGTDRKYGLCIRDMDQESNYVSREDLLLERAPSSIVDALQCSLDSWWEAKFDFSSAEHGDYYYRPLDAAWEFPNADGSDLLYCSGMHRLSGSDPAVVSCSIPLRSADGYPYAVLGIELSQKYLSSLLPNKELHEPDKCCYILAMQEDGSPDCDPLLGAGVLYNRCFGNDVSIPLTAKNATGGYDVVGRGDVDLYGAAAPLDVLNNNSPFEGRRIVLLAFVERAALFAYIQQIEHTLMIVSTISLLIGVVGILVMSRRFAAPIIALAARVRSMQTQPDFELERLGITEIDQLVDAIEALNRNVGKSSARTEFFSRMSHDMRTPMNAIIGFSSPELLEGASEAVKDDYLEKIHASGQYLLGLINEVLDMTKIESNKTELHFVTAQASRLFDTTIPIIEKLAQQKGIAFSVENRIDPGVYVQVDPQHVNQIVMNLLSNAVKFTPEGGRVTLISSLAVDPDDDAQSICRITVSDTGIGMSEAFLQKLYTPFEQENSRREGTGLGLSIAHKLVELMGGSMDCKSRRNDGTTFTVTLPLPKAAPEAALPGTGAELPPGARDALLGGTRVLVCEDNPMNLMIVQLLLGKWGVASECAENGRIGLDRFTASAEGTFDAILMDVRMPVMDGLAAAKAIRALKRTDAARIPIIAMTANAFEEDERASRAAGMNVHLAKPVEPDLLHDTLVKLLAKTEQEGDEAPLHPSDPS